MENLTNNHESMKTIVETFLIEETVSLIYDNAELEKWNNYVKELGLEGQTKIVSHDKSPIPFMFMKTGLHNVFETLCPRKVSVKEYHCSPIPLEILQLISLSEKENYFSKIEIWYDDKNPDPACIGVIENWILYKKGTYDRLNDMSFKSKADAENYMLINNIIGDTYNMNWEDQVKYYLIGKWGDVRRSIDDLKKLAFDRFTETESNDLRKQIKEYQRKLDDIQQTAFDRFN